MYRVWNTTCRACRSLAGGVAIALLLAAPSTARAEERVTLNGIWEFAPQETYARPDSFPARIFVPSFWNHPETFNYPPEWRNLKAGWFRRTLTVPEAWRKDRVALRFDGISMTGQVFFNGRHVANTWDALNPVTIDVTPWVQWGGTNEILVGVREAIAESDELMRPFDPRKIVMFEPGGIRDSTARALVPYGYQANTEYRQDGLSRDVWLVHTAPVYADNVFVRTSVRTRELSADYELRNITDRPQRVRIAAHVTLWKQEQPVLTLPPIEMDVPTGDVTRVTLQSPWKDADAWDPDHPTLYDLHTEVAEIGGGFVDRNRQRFGFRESWATGRNLFLNGYKLVLRADSLGVHGSTQFYDEAAFRELCRLYRRMNINAIRFHCHNNTLRMLDICDEFGLMVIAESGLHGSCGDQALEDPRFWKNAAEHLRTQVREERNHPSIVAWSIENEMGAFLQQTNPVAWDKLSALTRVVKKNDPTRLAWHDGYAYGVMSSHIGSPVENDVLALHYPCGPEAWALFYNVPESSLWAERMLRDPKAFGGMPLGIGEYAMAPPAIGWETDGTCHQPLHQAPFVGERKTTWPEGNLRWYWDLHWLGVASSVRGNRASGMVYISPFTTVQHYLQQSGGAYRDAQYTNNAIDWNTPGVKLPVMHAIRAPLLDITGARPPYQWLPMIEPVAKANHPLIVYPRLLGMHFWSGARVRHSFFVFNDLYRPSRLRLTIELRDDAGSVLDQWSAKPKLPPGEHGELTASLHMPKVKQRTAVRLHIRHASDFGAVFEDDLAVSVFPPIAVPKFVLVDPQGSTAARFSAAGLNFSLTNDLAGLAAGLPVVIGENALGALSSSAMAELRRAVEQGRTVVCLAHTNATAYAAAWGNWAAIETGLPRWPYQIDRGVIPTTVGHLTAAVDPVTAGLDPEDVRYWGASSAVAVYGLPFPLTAAGAKTLVMCNRPKQDDNRSLLARVPYGRGTLYLCQLLIADNVSEEPVARLLLSRLVTAAGPAGP